MPPRRRNWQSLPAIDPGRIDALSQALDLALAPTLVAHLRRRPLPRDVLTLIRLAAGCRETLAAAAAATGRGPDFLRTAAEFYLRQVVCYPGADPHRILGVPPQAPRAERRRHMRELVLWLHPDRGGDAWNAALMRRVLEAWRMAGEPQGAGPAESRAPGRAGPAPARSRRVPAYRPIWISRPLPKARPATGIAGARLLGALRLALILAGTVVPALGTLGPCGLTAGLLRLADGFRGPCATGPGARPAEAARTATDPGPGCPERPCAA